MKDEQGDDDVDGSEDVKFGTAATGGGVLSLHGNKGDDEFFSSTTVETPNESNQISAKLHDTQRVGNEVDSMYAEGQVAALDDGINNPIDALLSNAEVCIDLY